MTTPNFDEIAQKISNMPYGLVVINGPKGSGKSALLNLVESILGEGGLCDNFKVAKANKRSSDGEFQLIDANPGESSAGATGSKGLLENFSHLSLQQRIIALMRWWGVRTLAIEDIETLGSDIKYLLDTSIDLALTGTLVIVTLDALSLPEGRSVVETIEGKKYLGLEPLWIELP